MERPLEDKLRYLYALQKVDLHLDELEEMKGDLPQNVAELTAKENDLKAKIEKLESTIKSNIIKSDGADVEMLSLIEKIEKYKKQQFEVKSNKQYDALTREIENAEKRIEQLSKDINVFEGHIRNYKVDLETSKTELETVHQELSEKKKELGIVAKDNEEEELKYRHQREKLVVRIDKQDLIQYEKIRKAKSGKAIVAVKRNACGGCFNSVPAQKLLELRQNEKLYTCEYCGRILVSDKIVETSSNIV